MITKTNSTSTIIPTITAASESSAITTFVTLKNISVTRYLNKKKPYNFLL